MALRVFILEQGGKGSWVLESTYGARQSVASEGSIPAPGDFIQCFFVSTTLGQSQGVGLQLLELVIEGASDTQLQMLCNSGVDRTLCDVELDQCQVQSRAIDHGN